MAWACLCNFGFKSVLCRSNCLIWRFNYSIDGYLVSACDAKTRPIMGRLTRLIPRWLLRQTYHPLCEQRQFLISDGIGKYSDIFKPFVLNEFVTFIRPKRLQTKIEHKKTKHPIFWRSFLCPILRVWFIFVPAVCWNKTWYKTNHITW